MAWVPRVYRILINSFDTGRCLRQLAMGLRANKTDRARYGSGVDKLWVMAEGIINESVAADWACQQPSRLDRSKGPRVLAGSDSAVIGCSWQDSGEHAFVFLSHMPSDLTFAARGACSPRRGDAQEERLKRRKERRLGQDDARLTYAERIPIRAN